MEIKNDSNTVLMELREKVKKSIVECKWNRNDKPKDIAMSICIEAGELLEIFQWKAESEVVELLTQV